MKRNTKRPGMGRFIFMAALVKHIRMALSECFSHETALTAESSLNEWFDKYIQLNTIIRKITRQNYVENYDRYIRNALGNLPIGAIKTSDMYQFYLRLMDERKLSVNTINNINVILSPVFGLAFDDDIINKNPAKGAIRRIRKSTHQPARRRALTTKEIDVFFDFISELKMPTKCKVAFTVLSGTGVRISELLAFQKDDLDFQNDIIHVRHNLIYCKNKEGKYEFSMSDLKTSAARRDLKMLPDVKKALLSIIAENELKQLKSPSVDRYNNFVFISKSGGCCYMTNFNDVLRKIVKKYNDEEVVKAVQEKREPFLLPSITCHTFRHTFCTRLCEVESNVKKIQALMGHKDIKTTMGVYAEATNAMIEDVMLKYEREMRIG